MITLKLSPFKRLPLRLSIILACVTVAAASSAANLCEPDSLIQALQKVAPVSRLHNCLVEVAQSDMLVHGATMKLTSVFVADDRLGSVGGLDIWAEHPCEYRYDNYKNTHYYYDQRVVGLGQSKKRFIKLVLNRQGQLASLELGIQDVNSWSWESRVVCRANHFEEGL